MFDRFRHTPPSLTNLPVVARKLRALRTYQLSRDPATALSENDLDHLLEGYERINHCLREGIELLTLGQLTGLLQLNHIVLLGKAYPSDREYQKHVRSTEERFFAPPPAGVGLLAEWYKANRRREAFTCAAQAYALLLGQPQLFVEGNHRTGALLISYLLLQRGLPPLVLTPTSQHDFFKLSDGLQSIDKGQTDFSRSREQRVLALAALLRGHADRSCQVALSRAP